MDYSRDSARCKFDSWTETFLVLFSSFFLEYKSLFTFADRLDNSLNVSIFHCRSAQYRITTGGCKQDILKPNLFFQRKMYWFVDFMILFSIKNEYAIFSYFELGRVNLDDAKDLIFLWRVLNTDCAVVNDELLFFGFWLL
jgi:hypothetical protein